MGVIEELQLELFRFKYKQQGFFPVPVSVSSGIYSQHWMFQYYSPCYPHSVRGLFVPPAADRTVFAFLAQWFSSSHTSVLHPQRLSVPAKGSCAVTVPWHPLSGSDPSRPVPFMSGSGMCPSWGTSTLEAVSHPSELLCLIVQPGFVLFTGAGGKGGLQSCSVPPCHFTPTTWKPTVGSKIPVQNGVWPL